MSIITEIAPQVTIPEDLIVDADIPVAAPGAPCIQGDVMIVAYTDLRHRMKDAVTPIPAVGVTIAVGQGGHHHTLYGAGFFDARRDDEMVYGTLTVPDGATVLLLHTDGSRKLSDEHGALQIAPGSYRVGGQREQADEIRRVAD